MTALVFTFLLPSKFFMCLLDFSIKPQSWYHYDAGFSWGTVPVNGSAYINTLPILSGQSLWTYPPSRHSNSPPETLSETSLRSSCALPMPLFRPIKLGPLGMVTLPACSPLQHHRCVQTDYSVGNENILSGEIATSNVTGGVIVEQMHQFPFQKEITHNDLPGPYPTFPCGLVPPGSISVILSPSLKEISLSSAAS
jgi:hypothetical protein